MGTELHPVISVRLFAEEKCFGPGVAMLLRAVDERHSLRAAAKSLDMAYSKAWSVMRNAEAGLGFKLLSSAAGGRNGGGAALTDAARRMLAAYEDYCARLRVCGDAMFRESFAFLAEEN